MFSLVLEKLGASKYVRQGCPIGAVQELNHLHAKVPPGRDTWKDKPTSNAHCVPECAPGFAETCTCVRQWGVLLRMAIRCHTDTHPLANTCQVPTTQQVNKCEYR